jgi:hypothetical protein
MDSVCQDQVTFNNAVKTAIKQMNEDKMKENRGIKAVVLVLYLVLTVWALTLAINAQVSSQTERILHLIFAILASPVYILAYYLSESK